MGQIITLDMLRKRVYALALEDDHPLRLRLQGGSGQIKVMEIDCTINHLQIDDDGTVIIDVRGQLRGAS
ncbi:hypothetical protein SAMN02949497_1640 [Methylomagnum ishizawai]|uniref:Uncharacterized protein n=1 Tax=Methylomagnum ishizawai TaxID=1760988 RepID=A0A1Y6CVS5_9GAMM|nr:hypothetical protein [Methylomagnum ishizawai]SMF94330.1 hypothetical protein SAMN02949497_1640 [Methylomagnum ishizawai]